MKNLTKLVGQLKPAEIQHVRDLYQQNSSTSKSKKQALLNLLSSNKSYTDLEASQKIYARSPDSAFSQLKKRVKDDLLRALLTSTNDHLPSPAYLKADLECGKQILLGKILLMRDLKEEALSILTKSLKLAQTFELTDQQIIINDLLRTHDGLNQGTKKFDKYTEAINQSTLIHANLIQAKEYNYRQSTPNLLEAYQRNNISQQEEININSLSKLYSDTRSPTVGYWYYKTMVKYHQQKQDYRKSYLYGLRVAQLVEAEPAVHSDQTTGEAYMELAYTLISIHQLKKAIPHVDHAINQYPPKSPEAMNCLELLFFLHFRLADYDKCMKMIKSSPWLNAQKDRNLIKHKWIFFQANLFLAIDKISDAHTTLKNCTDLLKHKSTWQIEYRIVELLILIEQRDIDWLDFKIDSLRKVIHYHKLHLDPRISNRFDLLKQLICENGNYQLVLARETQKLHQLAQLPLQWRDDKCYDLICFNDLFKQKTLNESPSPLVKITS